MRIVFGAIASAMLSTTLSACGSSLPDEQAAAEAGQEDLGSAAVPVEASAPDKQTKGEDGTDLASPKQAKAAKAAQCTGQEETIFSCDIAGGKHLAVCVPERGKAEYRFGGDTLELTLTGGQWASVPYSGGGEAQIAFSNGDTRYIVFSRMVRTNFTAGEPNDPAISDGVIVERGGEVISVKECGGLDLLPIQYSAAEEHLPKADDLFTYETGRADPF